jgi:hypothetical protein
MKFHHMNFHHMNFHHMKFQYVNFHHIICLCVEPTSTVRGFSLCVELSVEG